MQRKKIQLIVIISIYLLVLITLKRIVKETDLIRNPNVNLIDSDSAVLRRNFSCVKTTEILNLTATTICVYTSDEKISESLVNVHIWQENEVKFLLQFLIVNPDIIMIDIGASIGSYSMLTSDAWRRLTISIDCYSSNIEHVQDRIVLIHNALNWKSDEQLQIRYDDPIEMQSNDDKYKDRRVGFFISKSIQLNDLLPILRKHEVKTVLIKIDIETSESYMCETCEKIFDEIDIPFVMMEWHSWRVNYQSRYRLIVDFFTKRNYLAMNETCGKLQLSNWLENWPGNIYWIKTSFQKNFSC